MNKIKKIVAITASVLAIIALSGCSLIKKSPEAIKKETVAKVNSEKITREQFDKVLNTQLAPLEAQYGADFASKPEAKTYITQLKTDTLNRMVMQSLLIQKAKELKLVPDENTLKTDIDKQYADYVKQYGGEDEFKKYLDTIKLTVDDVKADIRKNLVINKVYDNITTSVTPSDSDINTYYNTNLYDFAEKPCKMEVSHLLVDKEDTAQSIKKEIEGGLSFADAAKKYSIDTGTKENGGSLGEVYYSNNMNQQPYDPLFLTGAINAPLNKVSNPIKSSFGYHLIYVTKRETYNIKPLATVKEDVKKIVTEKMKSEKFDTTYKDWEKKAKITKYTDKL